MDYPVELGVEKELGITKEDIGQKISIEEYNAHCRRNVMMYTQEWSDLSHLMGYWWIWNILISLTKTHTLRLFGGCLKQLYQKGAII